MLSAERNRLATQTGPGTPCGKLMRHYWQPAALVEELDGARRVKPVRLLGESLVAFKDETGRYGLVERHCPHRGADLAYGRCENGGLRCTFHGWLFDVGGQCLETPAEPEDSTLHTRVRAKAYPGEDPAELKTPDEIVPLFLSLAGPGCTDHGRIFDFKTGENR